MGEDVAVRVEGLSKRYRLGEIGATTLRDSWAQLASRTRRWILSRGDDASGRRELPEPVRDIPSEIWALRDVTFSVLRGEVLGIVGRNGAGKSTILKILSRITEPTHGRATIRGRLSSLLEVGTGFHPELTGRENVFLNGAILGMTRAEIARKFDAIVGFAEVDRFIDTPVKRYSSGMYVRLAFAVAAHLDPDVLVVDEVLAVGDAAFQKKCMGSIRDASRGGRTILFVSHNMAAVRSLCGKAILLSNGRLLRSGSAEEIVSQYAAESEAGRLVSLEERTDRVGNGELRFAAVQFVDRNGEIVESLQSGDRAAIRVLYTTRREIDPARAIVAVSLLDVYRNPVALFMSEEMGNRFKPFGSTGYIEIDIPELLLRAGLYQVKLWASHLDTSGDNVYDAIEDAAVLHVLPGDYWRVGRANRDGNYCLIPATLTNVPT